MNTRTTMAVLIAVFLAGPALGQDSPQLGMLKACEKLLESVADVIPDGNVSDCIALVKKIEAVKRHLADQPPSRLPPLGVGTPVPVRFDGRDDWRPDGDHQREWRAGLDAIGRSEPAHRSAAPRGNSGYRRAATYFTARASARSQ